MSTTLATGRIVQIQGVVIDVEFPPDQLPQIYNALIVDRDDEGPLTLEVQQHLGNDWVRAVAMSGTEGLRRGTEVRDTGRAIQVPVGPKTLGRILNVTGEPIDEAGEIGSEEFYEIHRDAPSFEEQTTAVEVFETGVKVIDLVAPFTQGGKTGVFGG